jgi:TolB-like protein
MGRLQHIYSELRRRRVLRALVGWAVVSFAVLQVVEPVVHALHLPDWSLTITVVVLAAGFPATVVLAWFFDLSTAGITRTPDSLPGALEPSSLSRRRSALAGLVVVSAVIGAGLAVATLRTMDHHAPLATSIAVLPFADMSPSKDQEYLSDGIAEEIRSSLARVEGLRVAGRTSSTYFKGKNARIADIGRELNVGAVLEGGVRRDGDRIRITATIVNVADGMHAWSESWDKNLRDILTVENEIAREVVEALRLRLLGGKRPAVPEPARTTAEAHLHVLKGREAFRRGSTTDWVRAVEEYGKALKLDPGLSSAWAGLAMALDYDAEEKPSLESLLAQKRQALDAADRAVATGPDQPEAYLVRANLRGPGRHEWTEARADVERALALGGTGDAYGAQARTLSMTGRLAEALSAVERCVESEPLSNYCIMRIGFFANGMGQFDRGRRAFEKVLEIAPNHSSASGFLAQTHVLQGQPQEALSEAARSRGQELWRIQAVALAEHTLGHPLASQRALDDLIARFSHSMPFQIAEVCAWRGDPDCAFEWLDRADERRDLGVVMVTYSPFLASIRGDPRYKAFLRRLNLPAD